VSSRLRLRARAGQGAAEQRLGRLRVALQLEKLLHGRAQVRVAGALLVQERRPLRWLQIHRPVEEFLDPLR
jgi:hypothetical protein